MLLKRLCLTFVAIVSMTVACVAADAVRPVRKDLKVEDLGAPVQRRASWSLVYQAPPADEVHVFVTLTAGSGYGTDPTCEVVDFNLGTGEVVKFTGPKGGTYLRPGCVHPNGKMYCTTTRPVSLLEFDPGAKTFRIVGKLAGFYNTIHDVALAPDGVIFFGHNGRQLTSYDPKADKTGDHGIMGGEPASTNQFVYTLVADERYVYCAMANHGQWYLIVYDRRNGTQTPYFEPLAGKRSSAKHAFRGTDGKLYYGAGRELYVLRDGKPAPVENPKRIARADDRGVWSLNTVDAKAKLGLEIDTSGLTPTNWNNGEVVLRWRKHDAEEWAEAMYEGLGVEPNCVRRLAPSPDGGLCYGFGAHYGPLFTFDPATTKSEFLCSSPGSIYDIFVTDGYVYFSGYSAFLAIYDRNKPVTPNANVWSDANENPYKLPGAGKRTFKMIRAADGTIYACGNYGRHDSGADISCYAPPKHERVRLRDEVKQYVISDMCTVDQGRQIAAAFEVPGTTKTLFMVIDNASKKIVKRYEFDFGQHDSGVLLQAGPMQVIDVIAQRSSEDGDDGALLLKLDLETGGLLLKRQLEGKVFNGPSPWDYRKIDQRFCLGPDGCGWLFIDNHLTRIHPDGTVETLQELKQTGQLFFIGDDLYIYNGGRDVFGGFAGVLRIKGVFAEM